MNRCLLFVCCAFGFTTPGVKLLDCACVVSFNGRCLGSGFLRFIPWRHFFTYCTVVLVGRLMVDFFISLAKMYVGAICA